MAMAEHGCVLAALVIFILCGLSGLANRTRKLTGVFLFAGTAVNLAALVLRGFGSGHLPLSNQYESLLFTAFCMAGILVYMYSRAGLKKAVVPLVPLMAVVQLVTLVFYSEPSPLVPVLRSWWLAIHVVIVMLSYAALFLSFGCALLFILARYWPDTPMLRGLEEPVRLEVLSYKLVTVGYPLLLAGILTGAVWAKQAWGRYWGWDPKETWALVTWLVYTVYLHNRLKGKRPALTAAWINVAAFICVIFTYFGVNYLLAGLHSYAR